MNKNDVLTDPRKLVTLELKNAGFDIETIKVPKRVYLLADSLYDAMLTKNVGTYKYPLGGQLYVFNKNENVGFIKRTYVFTGYCYTGGRFDCRWCYRTDTHRLCRRVTT